ncbi:MAG: T9SS type A sorting domain-containing protein, partial [Fibrobacteria bacterium]|nr:T9SS type A sorting domain-containing protein [Fibrobacteria bacterium]
EMLNDFHSGNYRYSSDSGTTWGDWMTGSVDGGDRSAEASMTADSLPLKQQEDGKNLIEFAARDMNGNIGTRQLVIQSNDVVSAKKVQVANLENVRFSPNPFFNTTSLNFNLSTAASPELDIYDIEGTLVRSIRPGILSAGQHAIVWDGKGQQAQVLSAGQYFVRIKTGRSFVIKKVMMLK